jgi:DNA repair exonuclease SbcCD ATPase subunit
MTIDHEIYLRRMNIGAFKPFDFGNSLEIQLPDGPSAIILCGNNGLGKSSFLEAIQWTLTGTTSRISARKGIQSDEYVQNRSSQRAAEVGLTFEDAQGGEQPIRRLHSVSEQVTSLAYTTLSIAPAPEITDSLGVSLLRRLEMTHFLAQQAQSRMAETKGDELYRRLTEIAGLEIYDHAKNIIFGHQKSYRAQAFDDSIKEAADKHTKLDQLSKQFEILKNKAAAEALSPDVFMELVNDQLTVIYEPSGWPAPDGVPRAPADSAYVSGEKAEIIFRSADAAFQALGVWRQTTESWLQSLVDCLNEFAKVEKEIGENKTVPKPDNTNAAISAQSDLQAQIDEQLSRLELAEKCIDLGERIQANDARLTAVKQSISQHLAPGLEHSVSLRAKVQSEAAELARLQAEIDGASQLFELAQASIEQLQQIDDFNRQISEDRNSKNYVEHLDTLVKKVKAAEDHFSVATEKLASAERRYEISRETATKLKAAIGELRRLIEPSEQDCPFCGHKHETPEAMRQHANQFLQQQGVGLLEHGAALSAAREQQTTSQQSYERLTKDLEQATLVRNSIRAKELERDNLLRSITENASALKLKTSDKSAFSKSAEKLLNQVEDLRAKKENLSANKEALSIEDADARLENSRAKLESAKSEVIDLENSLKNDRDSLKQFAEEIGFNHTSLQPFRDEKKSQELALERLRGRQSELDALRMLLENQSALIAQWNDRLKSPGIPNKQLTDGAKREFNKRQKLAAKLEGDQLLWRKRVEAYFENRELETVKADLKEFLPDANNDDEFISLANAELMRLEGLSEEFEKTKSFAKSLSGNMEELGKTARDTFFAQGFGEDLNAHLRALSPHRNIQIELDMTANRGGGKQIRFKSRGLNVNNSFSEGEMAAVSLAAMLATARRYRWSRWPALLLDDPIQHEDAIHQAAFADAVRNLIKFESYQVFITTHDRGKAEYLARKMQPYGIPCGMISFSKSGDGHQIECSGDASILQSTEENADFA